MGDYIVFHDVAWDPIYAVYFFLIGLSAALFFFSALSWFNAVYKPLRKSAFLLSFALLAVSGVILIADLSQPARFFHLLNPAYWNMSSPLVWGTILLLAFGAVSIWYYTRLGAAEGVGKAPALIGGLLALAIPIYTGFDLSIHQHRPVWNTPLMPVLFVTLSLVSGAAVASFLARQSAALTTHLRQILLWGSLAAAVMTLSLLVTTAYGGSAEELTYQHMTSGTMGAVFVLLGMVGGTLVPVLLLALPVGRQALGMTGAAVLVLIGGMSLRYSILMGPQLVQTFFS